MYIYISKQVFLEIDRTLPVLRRLLSTELDNKGRERVVAILHTFTTMCQLPATDGEPHTQNQKILYNFSQFMLRLSIES